MIGSVADLVGAPVVLKVLKDKPGRRRTARVRGPRRTVIVKLYPSGAATSAARRVRALEAGPSEPLVPRLVHLDADLHIVVLSDVPGVPLRAPLLAGDLRTCARAGAALGTWHAWWLGALPLALERHEPERELEILREHMAQAHREVADAVARALPLVATTWTPRTVIHRDLDEEQIRVGDRIGLIDLDDVAVGPPELDLGNLVARLELLERRTGLDLGAEARAFVDGYVRTGPSLDPVLLARCRALALLRLACMGNDLELVERALLDSVRR